MKVLEYVARVAEIFTVFARQGIRILYRRLRGRPVEGHLLLREAFEQLSGSFLKFGQILALQIDTLPLIYCDTLLSLLDRVPPIPPELVDQVFIEQLGESPRTLFQEFQPMPVASASIGQVHRAKLKDGTAAAVKVQRPGVSQVFERDLLLMRGMVWLIFFLRIRSMYFMRDPVRELGTWTYDELDYRREASYCELLGQNAVKTPTERVPRIHWHLTAERILTMDYLEGPSVSSYLRMVDEHDEPSLERIRAAGFIPSEFSSNVISNFLSDAFRFGVFHADLHPANLIILPNNVVGYVDFGIVATLTPEARRKQIQLTMAYASGSADAIYREFLNICTIGPNADLPGLRRRIAAMAAEWYHEPTIGGNVRLRVTITRTMMDLLSVCQHYGVLVDREMIKYIRSTILADGLVSRLAPGFDLARILRSVVEEYVLEESRNRILSTAGAISFLTDLAVWSDASPRDFLNVLNMLERRQLRMHASLPDASNGHSAIRVRALCVGAVWILSMLFLGVDGGPPSFRASPFLSILAVLFVTLWSLWFMSLLRRLRAR